MSNQSKLVSLDLQTELWTRFYTVSPLVIIGTKENEKYDLAPKHMVTPLGPGPYFGFVCTPNHSTYHNVKEHNAFTVNFPKPDQVVLASLAASPRCGSQTGEKTVIQALPVYKASRINAPLVEDCYLYFECILDRVIDGFGTHSLITGRIISAEVDEGYLKASEEDQQEKILQHPYLVYLAHDRFASIKQTYKFPYPKDFTR